MEDLIGIPSSSIINTWKLYNYEKQDLTDYLNEEAKYSSAIENLFDDESIKNNT